MARDGDACSPRFRRATSASAVSFRFRHATSASGASFPPLRRGGQGGWSRRNQSTLIHEGWSARRDRPMTAHGESQHISAGYACRPPARRYANGGYTDDARALRHHPPWPPLHKGEPRRRFPSQGGKGRPAASPSSRTTRVVRLAAYQQPAAKGRSDPPPADAAADPVAAEEARELRVA